MAATPITPMRLDPETLAILDALAAEDGCSRTQVVRKLARDEARRRSRRTP